MKLYGAIIGDIFGSVYEWRGNNVKTTDIESIVLDREDCHFTDDTVLTVAIADACNNRSEDYSFYLYKWARKYPNCGFGSGFKDFVAGKSNSDGGMGNGAAMRVSPVAWAYKGMEEITKQAKLQAMPTHNHKDGLNGAMAVAAAICVAKNAGKEIVLRQIDTMSPYQMSSFTLDQIRPDYFWTSRARETVPYAIRAFYEGVSFEDIVRRAISIGGDSDTIASMAGAIAEAYYGTTDKYDHIIRAKLTGEMLEVLDKFNEAYR